MSTSSIQILGAARTVTGSMHLVTFGGKRLLLDCGLFQGKRADANDRNRVFPFDPRSIDALILSHAHIDHSGNIPGLVKQGFAGPIFCTSATRDLCAVMLADSAHIQQKDAEYLNKKLRRKGEPTIEPLYTPDDVALARDQFVGMHYEKPFDVFPDVTARFVDAGHILGSASVHLTIRRNGTSTSIGFTGDIGRWDMPIIRDPMFMGEVDVLISESTYGGVRHDPPADMAAQLADVLHRTFNRGGKIIVPAFSVGRTQDLVYALHRLSDGNTLPPFPIFVDSPLAINATEIYRNHPECYDEETRTHMLKHHDPLGMSQLKYVQSADESRSLNDLEGPCMIISASGMCEAGRILHHLANNIQDPRTTILIVGYQAEHTLGKKLVDQWDEVRIFGDFYTRKAEVAVLNSFSAHADGEDLLRYISRHDVHKLQNILLVHGEIDKQEQLAISLNERGYSAVMIPVRGETFDI